MVFKNIKFSSNNRGFTLVELVLAMGVSTIVMMAIFLIYKYQQDHFTNQLQVTAIQQNLRGALNLLSRDIRMAGFDNPDDPVAQIIHAEPDLFYFTYDINEDGDVSDAGEHIAYDITTDDTFMLRRTISDSDIPVVIGSGHSAVNQATNPTVTTAPQPAAANIENIEFFYLDQNGDVTTQEDKVQTVVISILARADQPDVKFVNNQTYIPASNLTYYNTGTLSGRTWVKNDNYRRRIQTLRVECRNVGL